MGEDKITQCSGEYYTYVLFSRQDDSTEAEIRPTYGKNMCLYTILQLHSTGE